MLPTVSRRAFSARVALQLQKRNIRTSFGYPLGVYNMPNISSGIEGPHAFERNKKTFATPADIAALKIQPFNFLNALFYTSVGLALFAILQTRWELWRYYSKYGYIYESGLDIFHYNSSDQMRNPIEGLPK